MTALHLGGLHPVEQVLMWVLAIGPFVLLAVVMMIAQRRDRARGSSAGGTPTEQDAAGGR